MIWSPTKKILFRFITVYVFLFCMSNQFIVSFAFEAGWQKLVPWFVKKIIGDERVIVTFTNGSGDTTYNYYSLLLYVITAVVLTVAWTILDHKRSNYEKLLSWLIILVRYYLIYQMVMYGLAKIFYMQFRPPSFLRLTQPLGEFSPMGLLWTFMGYSKGYTMFAGWGEMTGGLLLLFKRTQTLGAIVVFGVMANVMAMNYFYDVPVKILSTHLVLLSLFLIVLDAQRLYGFFLGNKQVLPREILPVFSNPGIELAKNILKVVLVVLGLGYWISSTFEMMKTFGMSGPKPPLYGLYEVESFVQNGDTLSPLITDSLRWHYLAIERKDRAIVKTMNNQFKYLRFAPDTIGQKVILNRGSEGTTVDTLLYSFPDSSYLHLSGVFFKDTLDVLMRIRQKEDFLLINRGFRWVNERPFNR